MSPRNHVDRFFTFLSPKMACLDTILYPNFGAVSLSVAHFLKGWPFQYSEKFRWKYLETFFVIGSTRDIGHFHLQPRCNIGLTNSGTLFIHIYEDYLISTSSYSLSLTRLHTQTRLNSAFVWFSSCVICLVKTRQVHKGDALQTSESRRPQHLRHSKWVRWVKKMFRVKHANLSK